MKEFRNPQTVHSPLASYSHQVEITGEQRWLILSGQLGMNLDGSLPDDPVAQLEIALDNISRNLKNAEMEIRDIVKLTIYLAEEKIEADKRRELFSNWLQGHQPCMTLLYVAALANPSISVEIEATACADV